MKKPIVFLAATCLSVLSFSQPIRPLVGAIRWDGWYYGSKDDMVTSIVEKTLGPKEFHDRLPFFARAQCAIIYAWNEYDEGGWLSPMLYGGSARIDSVGKMIAAFKKHPPPVDGK